MSNCNCANSVTWRCWHKLAAEEAATLPPPTISPALAAVHAAQEAVWAAEDRLTRASARAWRSSQERAAIPRLTDIMLAALAALADAQAKAKETGASRP